MSCGPVVILNVRKWLGRNHTSYREHLYLFEKWGFDEDGMWPKDLSRALNAMGIRYKRKSFAVVTDIEKALKNGNSVILSYAWHHKGRRGAHYVFIDRDTGKHFRAWNWSNTSKTPYISKLLLRRFFRFSKSSYNKKWKERKPIVWVIPHD